MENYKEEIAKLQTQLDELKSKIEKPQFELNKWYKSKYVSKCMFYINSKLSNSCGYGIDYLGNWTNELDLTASNESDLTPATPKEVEEALTKEAVKRGFKEGVKVRFEKYDERIVVTKGKLDFLEHENKLCFDYGTIFFNGTWATPIKTKTIDDILGTSDFYISAERSTLYDDLVSHIIKNKQEIIEALNNL